MSKFQEKPVKMENKPHKRKTWVVAIPPMFKMSMLFDFNPVISR